jgi:hypothetical protein
MCEHRPDKRGGGSLRSRDTTTKNGDAGELSDPPGQHGVREETDAER